MGIFLKTYLVRTVAQAPYLQLAMQTKEFALHIKGQLIQNSGIPVNQTKHPSLRNQHLHK
jgi:hypothetical protein